MSLYFFVMIVKANDLIVVIFRFDFESNDLSDIVFFCSDCENNDV